MRFARRPRYEQTVARTDESERDGGNLSRRLALTENDFRKALSNLAMLVDSREAKIVERLLAQYLKELRVRGLGRNISRADIVEERAKLLPVHRPTRRPKWLKMVDFGRNRTIKSPIGSREGFIICL
jgi:hypothetical protein